MNLLGLRYFIAISDYRSFTKASEALYVSQPTLSRQIADLEEELGVQLFERKSREIVLTPIGELCYKEAKDIIDKCDNLSKKIAQFNNENNGSLRIGYLGTIEHGLMAEPMKRFAQKYPNVSVSINRASLSDLNAFLLEEKCDIIYSVKVGVDSIKQLNNVYVADNMLKLIVPENHELAKRDSVRISELANEHFVLFNRNTSPLTVDNTIAMCVRNGFSPTVAYYVNDPQSMVYAVSAGRGVAFLSERMQFADEKGIKYLDIEDCDLDFSIVMAYKKHSENKYIPEYIKEVASEAQRTL